MCSAIPASFLSGFAGLLSLGIFGSVVSDTLIVQAGPGRRRKNSPSR